MRHEVIEMFCAHVFWMHYSQLLILNGLTPVQWLELPTLSLQSRHSSYCATQISYICIWFYNKNHKPHYWTLRTWKQEPFILEDLALSIRAESVRLDVVRSSSINHFLNVFSRDNWSNRLKDVRIILCIWKVLFQLCTKSRIGWFTFGHIEKILASSSINHFLKRQLVKPAQGR